jgi:peptidoglycan/LPS O-acetylase OafA/YrhL
VLAWLGHDAASVAYLNHGEELRIVAGFMRMASHPDHALALLLIGAGAVVWLPWRWRRLSASLRVMLVASVPAVAMFLAVGNTVELRMYSELVPVLGLGLEGLKRYEVPFQPEN